MPPTLPTLAIRRNQSCPRTSSPVAPIPQPGGKSQPPASPQPLGWGGQHLQSPPRSGSSSGAQEGCWSFVGWPGHLAITYNFLSVGKGGLLPKAHPQT